MDEIQSISDIQQLVREGFKEWKGYGEVTVREKDELFIFNYSVSAQYEARWNFFERVSRGLILHAKTGEVVARGFDKFFNWSEGGRYSTGEIVTVMEKLDGSLGILYRSPCGYHISTRGSFESEQGQWATQFLNANYDLTGLPNELTLLFEIIYPENRIVVNYEGRQDLVLLAARNRHTGDYLPFNPDVQALGQQFGFSLPHLYPKGDASVDDLIRQTHLIDQNVEGWVVEFSDGQRFKFKGQRYLKIHKLITGLSFKWTLDAIKAGTLEEARAVIPDEFFPQVNQWVAEIEEKVRQIKAEVAAVFEVAPKETRKAFALWVQKHHRHLAHYMFAHLDGKDIEPLIYKSAFRDR
jgi:RNA ligase